METKKENLKYIGGLLLKNFEKVVPIIPAKDYIPDWWKRVERMINSNIDNKGTVRNCPSFPEYITQGFVVPYGVMCMLI